MTNTRLSSPGAWQTSFGAALLWLAQTTRFAGPGENQGDLFTTRQPPSPTQTSCLGQVAAGRTGTVLGESWLNEAEITGLSAIEDGDLLRLCIQENKKLLVGHLHL